MAQMGGDPQLIELWNRFTTDWVMGTLTLVYVLCHLAAFVILGIALGRTRLIPSWAA
jgi:hypothetical protein